MSPSATDRRILIVEGDEDLRVVLEDNLQAEGHAVTSCATASSARRALELARYDLVVLDLMLPDGDGYAICRELRRARRSERVLMLTARSLEDDIVQGFAAGADDYVLKPYRRRELLARVGALLRRGAPLDEAPTRGVVAGFVLDLEARRLTDPTGRVVAVTRRELDLLASFVARTGVARTRDQLIDAAWGAGADVDTRTVDNFVASLKKKLGWSAGAGWRFVSVRGVGHRFEVDEER